MAYEVEGKYDESSLALRRTLACHPWATRGPTVLAALQKKIDSRRNESVVEEVLAGLDAAGVGVLQCPLGPMTRNSESHVYQCGAKHTERGQK